MENNFKAFSYNEEELRVILVNDEVWFIADQVCKILELTDVSKSLDRLDNDEKLMRILFVSGQNRKVWTINESGLYSLVLTSRKKEAIQFKKWITSQVIPSIRKTGQFTINTPSKEEQERFIVRNLVKKENIELGDLAHSRGIGRHKDKGKNNLEYATFHNMGYKGLYNGLTKSKISEKKLGKNAESILDYMDNEELSANWFRITQAKSKIINDNITGVKELNSAHQLAGKEVRETMLRISGTKIEELPFTQNIKSLQKRVKEEHIEPSKEYSPQFQSLSDDLYHMTEELVLFLMYFREPAQITIKELIKELPNWIDLPSDYYVQKTKNIISNRSRKTTIFYKGLAIYTKEKGQKDGIIEITKEGKIYVEENLLS